MTNLCGAPLDGADPFGMLPPIVDDVFLKSGVAMILMTSMAGQLNSQVNASHCMLDYVNNWVAVFTLYASLAIEASGLLHCCYLVQDLFSMISGKPIESKEPERTVPQRIFYWSRVAMSLAILGYAFAVTLVALFDGKTTMWDGVPNGVSVLLFFVFMSIVGMLEGMQIAFFAVTKLPKAEQAEHPMAVKTCELLFRDDGINLPRFMVGRQVCVTMCFFIIARVTTLDIEVGVDDNIFRVSNPVQRFFNTGLLGAIITTVVGSITWQLVASAFPVAFLSNPLVYVLLRICLLLEASGICSGAWVLAMIHKRISGFQVDEVYIGTPEERAAKKKADDATASPALHMGTNILTLPPGSHNLPEEWVGPFRTDKYTERRQKILWNLKELRRQLREATDIEEKYVYENSINLEVASLEKLNAEEGRIGHVPRFVKEMVDETSRDVESGSDENTASK